MSKQLSPIRHPILWLLALAAFAVMITPAFTQDASSLDTKIKVAFNGYVLNRTTGTFDTRATLTNVSAETFQAPISLVITNISSPTVTLANSAGATSTGKPYVVVPVPSGGFLPGTAVGNVILKFKKYLWCI